MSRLTTWTESHALMTLLVAELGLLVLLGHRRRGGREET